MNSELPSTVKGRALKSLALTEIGKIIEEENLEPAETIIMTHGAWRFPTRWGHHFSKLGFTWWYVPHGMLEPWSMQQKRMKKFLYFYSVEKRLIKSSSEIRAVGRPEQENLASLFRRKILLIPNGVEITNPTEKSFFKFPRRYLFMSRLHHKKGVLSLVKAWCSSSLYKNPDYELIIAGPDDGELHKLEQILENHLDSNIRYVGAVYGEEKVWLLESSNFFVLPSKSEGFPTSVLEAMNYGLIPIISSGCNFPEALDTGLAVKTGIEIKEILTVLEETMIIDERRLRSWSSELRLFVKENYSLSAIGRLIFEWAFPSAFL